MNTNDLPIESGTTIGAGRGQRVRRAVAALRSMRGTIIGCAILAFFSWPVHFGFMVFLAVPILMFVLLYSAFIMGAKPALRRLQALKVCLWFAVVVVSYNLQRYYETTARAAADEVIRAVLAYKEKTGSYPKRLQDAGVALDDRGGPWRIRYVVEGGVVLGSERHSLRYFDTYVPFSTFIYTFEARSWFYLPG